jgi:4-hydroxy-3-methylbut-2-enyl diphosphate reductase
MVVEIEKAAETGFCFGVRRAIDTVERMARELGGVETLRAVVHNRQVLGHLEEMGVRVASGVDDVAGDTVVVGAHGVSPETEDEIRRRGIGIIDTTCPFVRRAQKVANRLSRRGFVAVIYGDASHPEVKGILGWAEGKGMATLDWRDVAALDPLPRRLGVLAQTTQIPDHFTDFAATLLRETLRQDSELRVMDTICHGIRRRQLAAIDLAGRADLMLVVGDRTSSNTNRLAEMCALATETHLIETADDVRAEWLREGLRIGITGGTSTAEQTISQVLERIRAMAASRV